MPTLNQHIKNVKLYLKNKIDIYPSLEDIIVFINLIKNEQDYIKLFENMSPDIYSKIDKYLDYISKNLYLKHFKYYNGAINELSDGSNVSTKYLLLNDSLPIELGRKLVDLNIEGCILRDENNYFIVKNNLENKYFNYLTDEDNSACFSKIIVDTKNKKILEYFYQNQSSIKIYNFFDLLGHNKNISKTIKNKYIKDEGFDLYNAYKSFLKINNEKDMVNALNTVYNNFDAFLYEQRTLMIEFNIDLNLIPMELQKKIAIQDTDQDVIRNYILQNTTSKELIYEILDTKNIFIISYLMHKNNLFKNLFNDKNVIPIINDKLIDLMKAKLELKMDEVVFKHFKMLNMNFLSNIISYDYLAEDGYLKKNIQDNIKKILEKNENSYSEDVKKNITNLRSLIINNSELFHPDFFANNDTVSDIFLKLLLNDFYFIPKDFNDRFKNIRDVLHNNDDAIITTLDAYFDREDSIMDKKIFKTYLEINNIDSVLSMKVKPRSNLYFKLRNNDLSFEEFISADKDILKTVKETSSSINCHIIEILKKDYKELQDDNDKEKYIRYIDFCDKIDNEVFEIIIQKDEEYLNSFFCKNYYKLSEIQKEEFENKFKAFFNEFEF